MIREIITNHLFELLLIMISGYVAVKTYRNRSSSRFTNAFSAFATANMVFQILDFCMVLNRSGICFNGFAAGAFIYVVTLTAMAGTGYHWFIYVEEAIGAGTFATKKNYFLWSIPLIVFSAMCAASVKTGWIFTFDSEGKYTIGSLFILQYVVIFGYCLLAMVRSAANFLIIQKRRAADRTLFWIMLVDTIAVIIQLSFQVNMMNTALVLTVLLSYMTVYASEIERIKFSLDQERLLSRKQENESRTLAENNARFFALEDNFMSLYDVELESGHYVSYDRDEFYRRNVSDNVVSQTEFFNDLRTNVERVVYEEDREAVYEVQTRENILSALSRRDHIDHYYRIITDNGPMWLKMRIVYKNAEKKNVIVGIFNAEEEMAARQKEEQFKEELQQTNARLFALEDNFESLYDVNMESGHYDVFVKGEFFRDNVLNRLSVPKDYFEELRANINAVIYEEDRDGLYNTLTRESIRKELEENEHFDYRYRISSEGRPVWLKIRIVYKDADKKNIIIGVFNAEKDVEAQQLQEAFTKVNEANQNNELVLSFLNGIKWSYFINDRDEVIAVKYGESAKDSFDVEQIAEPMAWVDLVHPDDREKAVDDFMDTLRDHSCRKVCDITYRLRGSDGSYHWTKVSARVFPRENGIRELFGVSIDITDQMEKEREQQNQLAKARVAADAANQAKTNFLFNMSHDIRTPMNAIWGFTTMAKKNAGDEKKVIELLEKIDISGEQLLKLINQVLEMARIESGKVTFEEKPVNVREEFNSMVTVLAEQAKANGLKFNYRLGDIEHSYLLADEARVSSITLNITGNAMKYTPEGGSIAFELKEIPARKPGYATFVYTVSDTGIGMSREYLKELYEPFSREKSSTVSKIQGTGLGLSIVKTRST